MVVGEHDQRALVGGAGGGGIAERQVLVPEMDERPCERLGLRVLGGLHRHLERGDRRRAIAEEGLQTGDAGVGGDAGAQRGQSIGRLDGAIVVAHLHRRVGEVGPAHPVARLAHDRLLGECAGRRGTRAGRVAPRPRSAAP